MSDFWEEPERDILQNGRYRITDPDTNKSILVSRASSTGKTFEDDFAINRAGKRKLIKGLSLSNGTLRKLLTTTDPESLTNAELDEIATQASARAGEHEQADDGTAAHNALQAADQRRDDVPEEYHALCKAYLDELQRHGLTSMATEVLLYNKPFNRVGRADNIYKDRHGKYVIGDKKTTRYLELAQNSIACQLAVYASATHMNTDANPGENAVFTKIAEPMEQEYGVVVAIDLENTTVTLYRIDLEYGRRGAALEMQAKSWLSTKGILVPYVPPVMGADLASGAVTNNTFVENPNNTVVKVGPWGAAPGENKYQSPTNPAVQTNLHLLSEVITPAAIQPASDSPAISAEQTTSDVSTLAQLTKPELQQMLRNMNWTDVQHHRRWLAEKIVELRDKPLKPFPPEAPAAQAAAPPAPTAPTIDENEVIDEIDEAQDVAAVRRIHERITNNGQYPGRWTENMLNAAKERVAQIDESGVVADADNGGEELDVMADLTMANDVAELARIWNKVTKEGSEPGAWTESIAQAAAARKAELEMPKPTTVINPFA